MLKDVARYHCIQSQGKSMTQAQENGKKPHFRHDLGPLDQNSRATNFFFKNLVWSVTRYYGQQS